METHWFATGYVTVAITSTNLPLSGDLKGTLQHQQTHTGRHKPGVEQHLLNSTDSTYSRPAEFWSETSTQWIVYCVWGPDNRWWPYTPHSRKHITSLVNSLFTGQPGSKQYPLSLVPKPIKLSPNNKKKRPLHYLTLWPTDSPLTVIHFNTGSINWLAPYHNKSTFAHWSTTLPNNN